MKLTKLLNSLLYLFLFALISTSVKANSDETFIVEANSTYKNIMPKGYSITNFAQGDLNLDGVEDIIYFAQKNNEVDNILDNKDAPKRWIYIFLGQKNQILPKFLKKLDNVISCDNCNGIDYFSKMIIKNGYFSVEYVGSNGSNGLKTVITFKYDNQKENLFLHKEGFMSFSTDEPNNKKKQYTTIKTTKNFGIIPIEKYNFYKHDN
ncbi:MAG: hypothetical protein RLZZ210_945 [Pseudomonadota bacterium]|jgi:hypothetical protein